MLYHYRALYEDNAVTFLDFMCNKCCSFVRNASCALSFFSLHESCFVN